MARRLEPQYGAERAAALDLVAVVARFHVPTLPVLPLGATACALHWMVQQTCFQEMVARRRLDEEEYLDPIVKLWTRGVLSAPGGGS